MNQLEFLTVDEVSEILKIHWQTTLTYIKTGKIKAIKVGKGYRIAKEDLLDFINKNQVKPKRKEK